MTTTQEMVSVLFEKETISKAKELFDSKTDKAPIDSRDMTFRLFKTGFGNINLELLVSDNSGMFFKVIGFYTDYEKGGFFSSDKLSVTILKEFENDYKEIKNLDTQKLNIKFMSIVENAIIAAFSRETIEKVTIMFKEKEKGLSPEKIAMIGPYPHIHAMQFDKSLLSNGLQIDLLFSMDGFPQCFLDDEYEVEGAFGAYFKDANGLSLNPPVQHKANFDKFHKMGLFTAFNGL